jgi:hypothetical protein
MIGQTEAYILLLSAWPFYICPTFEIQSDNGVD